MIVLYEANCFVQLFLVNAYLFCQFEYGERLANELIVGWEGQCGLSTFGSCLLIAVEAKYNCGILLHMRHKSSIWFNLIEKVARTCQLLQCLQIGLVINVDVIEV